MTSRDHVVGALALGIFILAALGGLLAFGSAADDCADREGVLIESVFGWFECVERK